MAAALHLCVTGTAASRHGTPLSTSGDEACGNSGAHMLETGISSTRHIARFFHCVMPAETVVRTEPGHVALWVPTSALPGLPLSPWHRLVLEAVDQGRTVVELPT